MFVKILINQIEKSYIIKNKFLIMNLKERGITIGDLMIILIIIITTILVKSNNKDKTTMLNQINQEDFAHTFPSYKKNN